MKMQNKLFTILGITMLIGLANTSYGMEKFEDKQKKEFFQYLKKLPIELQQKIQKLAVQDAIIFLTDPIDLNDPISSVAVYNDVFITGGTFDGMVKIWNINNGSLLDILPSEDSGLVTQVAIYENLAAGCYLDNGQIKVWDINDSQLLFTIGGFGTLMSAVAINGNKLVTGGMDGIIHVWNIAEHALERSFIGHTSQVNAIVISGDNIITGGADDAKVWSMDGILQKTLSGSVYSIAVADNKIVTGSQTGVKIWDMNTGNLLRIIYDKSTQSVALSDNKVVIASAGIIKVWDINKDIFLDVLMPVYVYTASIAISNDKVITAEKDNGRIWTLLPYKGTPKDNPLLWIMHNANMMQLDFIKRAYDASIEGEELIIAMPQKLGKIQESDTQEQVDGNIYFSFPDIVREFLRNRFSIAKQ